MLVTSISVRDSLVSVAAACITALVFLSAAAGPIPIA